MKPLTKETAKTAREIASLLYAHKNNGFHEFIVLAEEMIKKYSNEVFTRFLTERARELKEELKNKL